MPLEYIKYGTSLLKFIKSNDISYNHMNDLAILWIEMIRPLRTNYKLIKITKDIMKHLESHPDHIEVDEKDLQFRWD